MDPSRLGQADSQTFEVFQQIHPTSTHEVEEFAPRLVVAENSPLPNCPCAGMHAELKGEYWGAIPCSCLGAARQAWGVEFGVYIVEPFLELSELEVLMIHDWTNDRPFRMLIFNLVQALQTLAGVAVTAVKNTSLL